MKKFYRSNHLNIFLILFLIGCFVIVPYQYARAADACVESSVCSINIVNAVICICACVGTYPDSECTCEDMNPGCMSQHYSTYTGWDIYICLCPPGSGGNGGPPGTVE